MATFALIHGAWHGGWAWGRLRAELERRGHLVVAPDLPCETVDAGVQEYAVVVRDALGGDEGAMVVGHSLGGMTIALVPARMHVYLCAYVPEPGRSLAERGPEAFGPGFAASLIRDELERSYWPDPVAAARDLQYPPDAVALTARLRRQARKPSTQRSPLEAFPETPRSYVVCTEDYAVPPDWQRRVARAELGGEPIELAAGHSPMLSKPLELADVLERLTGRC